MAANNRKNVSIAYNIKCKRVFPYIFAGLAQTHPEILVVTLRRLYKCRLFRAYTQIVNHAVVEYDQRRPSLPFSLGTDMAN